MTLTLHADDPVALALAAALQTGDRPALDALLAAHEGLATARIRAPDGTQRTPLHLVTDWPAHRPGAAASISALVAAGAEVDAPFTGAHRETPLHWAASSDDLEALDALLDAGGDPEAPGSVIDGGTPLADAVAFGQWRAARRLAERGARPNLWQAAALGDADRTAALADGLPDGDPALTNSLWCACHGGRRATAELLLARGADPRWTGHDGLTCEQAARREGHDGLGDWLAARGA